MRNLLERAFLVIITIILMFAVYGCQSEQDRIYSDATISEQYSLQNSSDNMDAIDDGIKGQAPVFTPAPDDELSGTLTVKTYRWYGEQPNIYLLAREFMELHPNVTITFDYEIDGQENYALSLSERALREENYYARLRTELLSGEGDDLLFNLADQLNPYQLSANGILMDLQPYWENDPEINPDDYFMKVLEAFKTEGKLTTIPLSFSFRGIFLNRTIIEEMGVDADSFLSVNATDVLGLYEKARENNPDLQLFFSAMGKDVLLRTEIPDYMNLADNTATFYSPDFIELLEKTGNSINDDPELDLDYEIGRCYSALADELLRYRATGKEPLSVLKADDPYNGPYNIVTKGRISFAALDVVDMYQLINFQQPFEYLAGPFPLATTNGKLSVYSAEDFAVPASCKSPELAWQFIKYCISERKDTTFSHYGEYLPDYTKSIALNKKNFMTAAERLPKTIEETYIPGYANIEPVDGVLLLERLERILELELINADQYGVDIMQFLNEYYINELTTAEQCAKKIQNRAEIWLGE